MTSRPVIPPRVTKGIDEGTGHPLVVAQPGIAGVEERLALVPGDDGIAGLSTAIEDVAEHEAVGTADQPMTAEVAVDFDDQSFSLAGRHQPAPERPCARLAEGVTGEPGREFARHSVAAGVTSKSG